ncbi:MAG: outer membrane beta-barrel protein [Bacteroidales bacterium]|nr:outer membrane beta-barrel protein [Bacteroidales bacterium]
MKKILLTLALAAFAMTANAQWVLGGTIAASHTNTHNTDYVGGTTNNHFEIAPKIGYWLNDNMQIGAQIGWAYDYTRNYAGDVDHYGSTSNTGVSNQPTIMIAPYFRYNVASWKNFTVFAEAQLALGLHLESSNYTNVPTEITTDNGDNYTSFGLAVIPGLNYAFTDHISMDIYVNLLGCFAMFETAENWGSHAYGLGLNMDAQSLNAHLNNFAIGFNYSF